MSTPSIFLPGWGLGRGPMEKLLADTSWQIVDLPGVAGGIIPAHFDNARDALLDTLPPLCHLGGWSLGAMLALACAAAAPERIASLTLVAATPSFVARPDWPHGSDPVELQGFIAKVAQEGARIFPRFIGNFNRGDAEPQAATRQLLQQATPSAPDALNAGLVWLSEADLRERLHTITCPITLIHGANDLLIPLAAAEWLKKHLPHAKLRVLPNKAHAPFSPDSGDFLRALPVLTTA